MKLKQVSIYFPVEDWLRLRRFAAAQNRPMTEIVRDMLQREIAAHAESELCRREVNAI